MRGSLSGGSCWINAREYLSMERQQKKKLIRQNRTVKHRLIERKECSNAQTPGGVCWGKYVLSGSSTRRAC
jgi:hypothetical protein